MSPRQAFALVMSLVYTGLGSALLFSNAMDRLIPKYRPAIGGVIMAYGILRLVTWWSKRQAARKAE